MVCEESREHQDVPCPGEFSIHMEEKRWWLNTGKNWETRDISSLPDQHLLAEPGARWLAKELTANCFFFNEKILNKDIQSAVFLEFHSDFLRGRKEKFPHDQNGEKEKVVQNRSAREKRETCH